MKPVGSAEALQVYCDHDTASGGWLVSIVILLTNTFINVTMCAWSQKKINYKNLIPFAHLPKFYKSCTLHI